MISGALLGVTAALAVGWIGAGSYASNTWRPTSAILRVEGTNHPAMKNLPATSLWRAQALATLQRWPEALPLYQKVAAQNPSPFRTTALLGQAEALRALQRFDEALQAFSLLLGDPQWNDRAQLRSIELLLEKRDNTGARRVLDKARPAALSDKKEKRYLQGRLEAQLNHHERAIELYQTILRRPEGATRAVLIATLCAMAESHLQLLTPEAGGAPPPPAWKTNALGG